MNLTRKEAIEKHREMWRWLAKEMESKGIILRKIDYFDAMGTPDADIPRAYCFVCDYADSLTEEDENTCMNCPILWDCHEDCRNSCLSYNSSYVGYCEAWKMDNLQLAISTAKKISELPEKGGDVNERD